MSEAPETSPADKPRVLVLHESRIMRASITRYLKQAHVCLEAADFEAGWQVLHDTPDIRAVLLDIGLPGEAGVEFIRRVRASGIDRLRELPLIVIVGGEGGAGNSLEEARAHALAAGAVDFIGKATTGVEMLARVAAAIRAARPEAPTPAASVPLAAEQVFALCERARIDLAAVALAIDNVEALEAESGPAVVAAILRALEGAIGRELRREDVCLPPYARQRVVLLPARNLDEIAAFAQAAQARVAAVVMRLRGAFIQVSCSVGAASLLADAPRDVGQLIERAQARADEARAVGPAQLRGASLPPPQDPPAPPAPQGVDAALNLLHDKGMTAVKPLLPELVVKLIPLMRLMEREYQSNFKLSKLKERASANGGSAAKD